MNTYQAGNDIKLTVPFADANGGRIYPNSASYRVLDMSGAEVVASTALSFDTDDTEAAITVPAVNNTLSAEITREMRVVELTVVTSSGVFIISERYLIVNGDGLEVNTNTFMLYNEALLQAFDIPATTSWDESTERERIAALTESYFSINKLKFLVSGFSSAPFSLSDLDDTLWAEAPSAFVEALKRAQIAEADRILGGDWIEDKRRDGLMSETIGESSNMFRPGKPVVMRVGSRAMRYLAGYISLAKQVGRG